MQFPWHSAIQVHHDRALLQIDLVTVFPVGWTHGVLRYHVPADAMEAERRERHHHHNGCCYVPAMLLCAYRVISIRYIRQVGLPCSVDHMVQKLLADFSL